MEKITEFLKSLLSLLGLLLGVAIFAELLFGSFLGDFSIIGNLITIVGKFGAAGFPGLIALLLVLHFANK